MRRGPCLTAVVAGALLLVGCSGELPTPEVSVTAATALPAGAAPPSEPTGPAPLPGAGAVPMTDRELVLARALSEGAGAPFPPSTCGVREVAAVGEDLYGWAFCTFRYPGAAEDSGMSGIVGLRAGRLWAPQDGARHPDDVVDALGAERADWVLEHEADLADEAQARHG